MFQIAVFTVYSVAYIAIIIDLNVYKSIISSHADGINMWSHPTCYKWYKAKIKKICVYLIFLVISVCILYSLQWRHNERDCVSNHQCLDDLLNRLFGRRSYKISTRHVTSLCEGNLPVTGGFPSQRSSNAENVSVWWRHHVVCGLAIDINGASIVTIPLLYLILSLPESSNNSLRWHHNGRHGVSYHQPYDCLLNRLFGHRSKETSKLRVTGLCAGNSPGTGEFPTQMASNADNVSIWWRHHDSQLSILQNGTWLGITQSCVTIISSDLVIIV